MWFVLGAISVIVLILIVQCLYYQYKYFQQLKNIPGPTPLPIIGNLLLFRKPEDIVPAAFKLQETYKSVMKLFFGWKPRLFLNDPKLVEFLLSSTTMLDKSYEYTFFEPWLNTGLLTSTGSKWKLRRKLITPTFHFQILEQFITTFNNQSSILVDCLKSKLNGEAFDIYPFITLCTLDVICEAAMGTSVNAQKQSENEYVRSVKDMCKIIPERMLSPLKMVDFLYTFTNTYTIQQKTLSILHNYTTSVINERRQAMNKDRQTNTNESQGIKPRLAFLDFLLQCNVHGQNLSTESIREEVDTFMFEGHDTTASAVGFTIYCLSKNKDVQDKVIEELEEIFQDDKYRTPTYQDLQSMKYLEMVLKESMRLYPPVPFFSRTLHEDMVYENNVLPKGLVLTVISLCLHRIDTVFPDPLKFDPERFTAENCAKRSPYAYVPFSAGPRNCIGKRFAMLELKSLVSKLLRNYEFMEVPGHEPVLMVDAILKSNNGLPVILKKRDF